MNLRKNQIRTLLTILISQFLLVALLSGFMYREASKTLREQSKEHYTRMLMQLDKLLEHTFREVENVIAGVSRDPDLYDYALLLEEREWIRILRTHERIDALIAANKSIDSIHIHYKDRREVLDSKKGLIREENFFDRDFLQDREDNFIYPDWSGPRILSDGSLENHNDGNKVLTVVKPLGGVSIYNTTSIIVNIPWEYLEGIIDDLGFSDGMSLFLYKSGREPVLLNSGEPSLQRYLAAEGRDYLKIIGETKTGWSFVSIVPTVLIFSDINRFLRFTLYISSAVLLLGLLLSFLLSNRFQAPISQMLRQLNGETGIHDEIGYITGYFWNRQLFSSRIEEEKKELKDRFPFDLDRPFRILVLSFSEGEQNCWNRSETYLRDILKGSGGKGIIIPSHKVGEVIILYGQSVTDERLRERLAEMSDESIAIGVSLTVKSASQAPLAYGQAKRALNNRISQAQERVFFYDPSETDKSTVPVMVGMKVENRIKELFREKNKEGLIAFVDHEIERILNRGSESPDEIRFLFFQIFRILLDAYRETGGKDIYHAKGNWSLLDLLFSPVTLGELRLKMKELIGYLIDGLPQEIDGETLVVEKTKNFILSNLSGDLSVENIADNVYVSRSHLSKIFSEKTNITLKDYIDRQRLDRAKELLIIKENRIQDIGRSVGYENVQSFIRLFKKREGLTPGEFRKRLPPLG